MEHYTALFLILMSGSGSELQPGLGTGLLSTPA